MTEIAAGLAAGALTSRQITDAYLARIDEVQAKFLPYAITLHDEARAAADAADARRANNAPLSVIDGVPLSIKESLDMRGLPSTLGLPSRRGQLADSDAVIVRVLREAGAVFLGKTNLSQAMLYVESSNPVYGVTKNPHDVTRGPGGSSGGEGAAIASAASPAGVGTDIGGSIRVPAHFSGVCGLKPTTDRWSNRGSSAPMPGQEGVRGQCGPMGRTVADLALLMEVATSTRQATLDPRVPPAPLASHTSIDLRRLRVGVWLDDGFVPPSAAVVRGVQRAAEVLRAAGASVEDYTPPLLHEGIFTYLGLLSADGGRTLRSQLDGKDVDGPLSLLWNLFKLPDVARVAAGRAAVAMGEPHLGNMLLAAGEKRVSSLWALVKQARDIAALVHTSWQAQRFDAVICPAHATPALPLGKSRDFTLGGTFSMHFNLWNFPAGVVPVTSVRADEQQRGAVHGRLEKVAAVVDEGSAGLPIGVQVAAAPWREDIVLAVMAAIEAGVRDDEGRPQIVFS
jgi:fatty acid amide hydrolase